jgi:hypothetical protein
MLPAIEFIVLCAIVAISIGIYRRLIHSQRFSKFIIDIVSPSPEEDGEFIERLDCAEKDAKRRVKTARQDAKRLDATAKRINRRLNRHSDY